jgi:hypothetical protein
MRQMESMISGIVKLQGFTDIYEISLDVPELSNGYVSNLIAVKLYIGPDSIDRYKRLYLNEEKFVIMLP